MNRDVFARCLFPEADEVERPLPQADLDGLLVAFRRVLKRVNGEVRQQGSTSQMLFPLPRLITYCSSVFTLNEGDLIYTGTPKGVGPVFDGDRLTATISGLPELSVEVSRR